MRRTRVNGNGGNSLTPERVEKFKTVVEGMKNGEGKVFILFTQPDPDAIASAYVLQKILEFLGCDSQIVYSGRVSHPQNVLLWNTFDLNRIMTPITEVTIAEIDHVVLVDSHTVKDSRLSKNLGDKKAEIIIDHHRLEGRLPEECQEQFYWIEDCGACVTMIYLLSQAIGTSLNTESSVLIALGIYTDTKNLLGASFRDSEVYLKVVSVDGVKEQFVELARYRLSPSYYTQLGYALSENPQHKWRKGSRVLCSVGVVPKDDIDHIAIIADELLREEGASFIVVYGIIDNGNGKYFVKISARSTNLGLPLDTFLARTFSNFGEKISSAKVTPDGRGEGGAHLCLDLGAWMQPCSLGHVKNMVAAIMKSLILPQDETKEED